MTMTSRQKIAFWGAMAGAAKAVGRGAGSFGKGLFFAKPMAGAGAAGKAMNFAGKATSAGAPIAASMAAGSNGPSVMGFGGGSKVGSLLLERAAVKVASWGAGDVVDAASYGSFIGAKFVDPVKYPTLHTALDAAGLLGLTATTAHGLATTPAERGPATKDLIGLGLMGSALYDRAKQHGH